VAARAAGAQLIDRPEVEEVDPVGGLEGPAELVGGGELGVVEQGPVHRCDRDPVDGGAVARVEGADVVDSDPVLAGPGPARNGDVGL
jgi:hypothetical protein